MSLWNVRALRRFLDKLQTNVYEKFGESFLVNLCWHCGLSKNASEESDTSISVESVGSQKIPWQTQQMKLGEHFLFYLYEECGLSESALI